MDSYIQELSQDPEFKKQIDYLLEKRYKRGLEKVNKEKEQTDLIIDICTEHPSLENNLKGMIRAVEELDKLKENEKTLDEEMKKIELPQDQDKLMELITKMNELVAKETDFSNKRKINKDAFMAFCQKSNVNIDGEILDKIIEKNRFAHAQDKDGKDDIQALKSLKRISKGHDKQKAAYEKAIEQVSGTRSNTVSGNSQATINNSDGIIREQLPRMTNNVVQQQAEQANDGEEQQTDHGNNLPDRTYKWYQFGKRFKAWRERRRAQRNGGIVEQETPEEPIVEAQTQDETNTENNNSGSNQFKDAYKYDIVKDYVNKKEKEILSEAGKQVRRENSENER